MAEAVQDQVPFESGWLDSSHLQYQITVDGRPSMQIFGREPVESILTIDAADTDHWVTPTQVSPPTTGGIHQVNVVLGEAKVRLLGYDLDTSAARPGGQIVVTLYWQALAPFDRNYQTFVHLVGDESLFQHDGAPECNINPTTRWEPGQIIPDPHIVLIKPDLTAGLFSLKAGMYDLVTLEPLPIEGGQEHLVDLRDISIDGS